MLRNMFSNTRHQLLGIDVPCRCAFRDVLPGTCMICDGGLASCAVCCGGEATLPMMCPGRMMTFPEMDAVQNGSLDWVQPNEINYYRLARRVWIRVSELYDYASVYGAFNTHTPNGTSTALGNHMSDTRRSSMFAYRNVLLMFGNAFSNTPDGPHAGSSVEELPTKNEEDLPGWIA